MADGRWADVADVADESAGCGDCAGADGGALIGVAQPNGRRRQAPEATPVRQKTRRAEPRDAAHSLTLSEPGWNRLDGSGVPSAGSSESSPYFAQENHDR